MEWELHIVTGVWTGRRWEVIEVNFESRHKDMLLLKDYVNILLTEGWEPFSVNVIVTDTGYTNRTLSFKRQVEAGS